MPGLGDDEDVKLFVDDGPAQRRRLVADRTRIDAPQQQTITDARRSSVE